MGCVEIEDSVDFNNMWQTEIITEKLEKLPTIATRTDAPHFITYLD